MAVSPLVKYKEMTINIISFDEQHKNQALCQKDLQACRLFENELKRQCQYVKREFVCYEVEEPRYLRSYSSVYEIKNYMNNIRKKIYKEFCLSHTHLCINFIGHGNSMRTILSLEAFRKAVLDFCNVAEIVEQPWLLEHITIKFWGCKVDADWTDDTVLSELRKLRQTIRIPIVIIWGGVEHNLTTKEFLFGHTGYNYRVKNSYVTNHFSLPIVSYITINGAQTITMRTDWRYTNKATWLCLCPKTGSGLWVRESKGLKKASEVYNYEFRNCVCYYIPKIRTSCGIPREFFLMKKQDFKNERFIPKILR